MSRVRPRLDARLPAEEPLNNQARTTNAVVENGGPHLTPVNRVVGRRIGADTAELEYELEWAGEEPSTSWEPVWAMNVAMAPLLVAADKVANKKLAETQPAWVPLTPTNLREALLNHHHHLGPSSPKRHRMEAAGGGGIKEEEEQELGAPDMTGLDGAPPAALFFDLLTATSPSASSSLSQLAASGTAGDQAVVEAYTDRVAEIRRCIAGVGPREAIAGLAAPLARFHQQQTAKRMERTSPASVPPRPHRKSGRPRKDGSNDAPATTTNGDADGMVAPVGPALKAYAQLTDSPLLPEDVNPWRAKVARRKGEGGPRTRALMRDFGHGTVAGAKRSRFALSAQSPCYCRVDVDEEDGPEPKEDPLGVSQPQEADAGGLSVEVAGIDPFQPYRRPVRLDYQVLPWGGGGCAYAAATDETHEGQGSSDREGRAGSSCSSREDACQTEEGMTDEQYIVRYWVRKGHDVKADPEARSDDEEEEEDDSTLGSEEDQGDRLETLPLSVFRLLYPRQLIRYLLRHTRFYPTTEAGKPC